MSVELIVIGVDKILFQMKCLSCVADRRIDTPSRDIPWERTAFLGIQAGDLGSSVVLPSRYDTIWPSNLLLSLHSCRLQNIACIESRTSSINLDAMEQSSRSTCKEHTATRAYDGNVEDLACFPLRRRTVRELETRKFVLWASTNEEFRGWHCSWPMTIVVRQRVVKSCFRSKKVARCRAERCTFFHIQ